MNETDLEVTTKENSAKINANDLDQIKIYLGSVLSPVDLSISIIEAHHIVIRKGSHALSILDRGMKLPHDELLMNIISN